VEINGDDESPRILEFCREQTDKVESCMKIGRKSPDFLPKGLSESFSNFCKDSSSSRERFGAEKCFPSSIIHRLIRTLDVIFRPHFENANEFVLKYRTSERILDLMRNFCVPESSRMESKNILGIQKEKWEASSTGSMPGSRKFGL
jgi:hypothetical protein